MSRILLIDDDPLLTAYVAEILKHEHSVDAARDGREGLGQAYRQKYDVAIVDIFMPERDGLETIHALRVGFPRMRLIAISGGGVRTRGIDYLRMARAFGCDRALAKPFTAGELRQMVGELMAGPRSAGQAGAA